MRGIIECSYGGMFIGRCHVVFEELFEVASKRIAGPIR